MLYPPNYLVSVSLSVRQHFIISGCFIFVTSFQILFQEKEDKIDKSEEKNSDISHPIPAAQLVLAVLLSKLVGCPSIES